MKIKYFYSTVIAVVLVSFFSIGNAVAEEKATPDEVFDLILNAVTVVEELGEEGLEAFNDPKGEFVYKDTYVFATDCKKLILVGHPVNNLIGRDITKDQDKNPDPSKRIFQGIKMCEASKKPYGGWVEYYWEIMGEDKPKRKISFSIQVHGTDYSLTAGIYDENTSLEELNSKLK